LADIRLKQIELLAAGDVEPRRAVTGLELGPQMNGLRTPIQHRRRWTRRAVHLLVQMLVQRCWTSRPIGGTVGLVMRIDGRAALTLSEAARWLGLTVPCIHALIERGELPFLREPDGSIRISAAALVEWAGKAGGGDSPPTPK
jgi:excisionase family DNA binding protein